MHPSMIHPSIEPYMPQVIELLKQHQITRAYLFGSVLTEQFNDDSDLDVLVDIRSDLDPTEAGGHLWDLTYALQDLLHRHVDLLTSRSLRNPYFIQQVNATKYPIYGQ